LESQRFSVIFEKKTMIHLMPNGFKFLSEAEKILNEQGLDGKDFVKWCKVNNPGLYNGCYGLSDLNNHANHWFKLREEERIARQQLSLF
jgi:hypothetical protein